MGESTDSEEKVEIVTENVNGGAGAQNTTMPEHEQAASHPNEQTAIVTSDEQLNSRPSKVSHLTEDTTSLSKNQLKKLKRKQQWEDGREARKVRRKEKIKEKRERRRAEYAEHASNTSHPSSTIISTTQVKAPRPPHQQAALSIVFDCQYDSLMTDNERVSLAGQITRAYSENRRAPIRAHLFVSSFSGSLKHRYEIIQKGHYKQWTGIRFMEEDFTSAAQAAADLMAGPEGGKVAGALSSDPVDPETANTNGPSTKTNMVYLTADSPHTLSKLHANTTYIIGGLVDRNRHKGACYKQAIAAGCQTAKLPIGEFLARMSSRAVLTTTHVAQILLRWVEKGDWGEAMVGVVPERKGGNELRVKGGGSERSEIHGEAGERIEELEEEEEASREDEEVEREEADTGKENDQ